VLKQKVKMAKLKSIILINGKARSGKDTFADMLMSEMKGYNCFKTAFAKELKKVCSGAFGKLTGDINGTVSKHIEKMYELCRSHNSGEVPADFRDLGEELMLNLVTQECNWQGRKNIVTRGLLQNVGTEIFRKYFKETYWTDILNDEINSLVTNYDYILVSDWRYYNEYKEVLRNVERNAELGGSFFADVKVVTIQVRRDASLLENNSTNENHSSEGEALPAKSLPTFTIDNNGTLKELKLKARAVADKIMAKEFGKSYVSVNFELPGAKTYKELAMEEALLKEINGAMTISPEEEIIVSGDTKEPCAIKKFFEGKLCYGFLSFVSKK